MNDLTEEQHAKIRELAEATAPLFARLGWTWYELESFTGEVPNADRIEAMLVWACVRIERGRTLESGRFRIEWPDGEEPRFWLELHAGEEAKVR